MSKAEADGLNQLDINWLRREKILEDNCWSNRSVTWTHRPSGQQSSITVHASLTEGEHHIKLIYTVTHRSDGSKEEVEYTVPIASTPCHFGGCRYWFVCSLSRNGGYCGRRVSKLYFIDKYFGCRHCHDLTYASRNLSGAWKTMGNVISEPDLEEMESNLKRKYYSGKITKKYKKLLYKQDKNLFQMQTAVRLLNHGEPL